MECFIESSERRLSLPLSFEQLGDIGSITASLVVDGNGSHLSPDGTSKGIGNDSDLELLIWLRRRASAILTSGLTARLELYKLPKLALLAILTREGVPHLSAADSNQLLILPREVQGYVAAVDHLVELGHSSIHTEFGPAGFVELVASGRATGLISSKELGASSAAAEKFGLRIQRTIELKELEVAVATGRG